MKIATKLLEGSIVEICDEDVNIKDFVFAKLNSAGRDNKDDAFHVCDLGDIVRKWKRFQDELPQVQPFYAVKCNPEKLVLKQLGSLGANFDCASKGEIKTILDLGISPDRIIFANPCKQVSHIKYANTSNVKMMTFDNEMELHKVKQHYPNAELIIRIKVDDSKSLCKLGIKYGVDPLETGHLLEVAWELGLNVIGVSFHVGSGCYDASQFYNAIKLAKTVFDEGNEIGYRFKILDIGGGFPGTNVEKITFEDTARAVKRGFAENFPPSLGVKIIAEPGRYFVASAYTTICNITSMRKVTSPLSKNEETEGFMYYLNDGVYGSFNCILYDHQHPIPYSLKETDSPELYECSVWGPTCDSLDCISASVRLPKLTVGDWICFDNMGAYTMAAASQFNGFKMPKIHYMCHRSLIESSLMSASEVDPYSSISCKCSAKLARANVIPVASVC